MGNILKSPNGNCLLLIPRSASHSLCLAAMESFWPDLSLDGVSHPAAALPDQIDFDWTQQPLAVIVRNPFERFRSMVAHSESSVDQQLDRPRYRPIPQATFTKRFLFETQLEECAKWLGITVALKTIDSTEETNKPTLTAEQEDRVREIYATDLAIWESLQS